MGNNNSKGSNYEIKDEFEQQGEVFTESRGIEAVLEDPENSSMKATTDDSVVVIIGAGYHIVNAFKPKSSGLAPDGGRIDASVTISKVIEDIEKAESVSIRKNPLDAEAKELEALMGENPTQEMQDKRTELMEKYKTQLGERKAKTINWLKTLADVPEKSKICFVRNVLLAGKDTKAKPSWVSGLIKELLKQGQNVDIVLDFGSGKVAATASDGTQSHNVSYDDSFNLKEYLETIRNSYPKKNIVARLTGKWRKPENKEETDKLLQGLKEHSMWGELLTIENEAKYASTHTLSIVKDYYPHSTNFTIQELGRGSRQGAHFQRKH